MSEPEDFKTVRVSGRMGEGGHGADYPELDPAMKKGIIEFFNGNKKFFNAYLGLRLVDVKRGYSKLEVECVEHLCQPAMVMHGGASFGMADAAVAMAMLGIYGPGRLMLTIEMKINYLEPIPLGLVTAEAYILRASKRSAYGEVDIWAAGRLAARATSTYMIRERGTLKV
jgi:acyl-CoA thioesterase